MKMMKKSHKTLLSESLYQGGAFMLRSDNTLLDGCYLKNFRIVVHPYILYDNTESTEENIKALFLEYTEMLSWFYINSKDNSIEKAIRYGVNYGYNFLGGSYNYFPYRESIESNAVLKALIIEKYVAKDENDTSHLTDIYEMCNLFEELNTQCNERFLRIRIGGEYRSSDNSHMYCRVSSTHVNWFDMLWQLVMDNQDVIEYITVERDEQATGVSDIYRVGDTYLNMISVDEFINLKGTPVIEMRLDRDYETKKILNEDDSDYVRLGNIMLPRNMAGMPDDTSFTKAQEIAQRKYNAEQEEKRQAKFRAEKERVKQEYAAKGKEKYDKFVAVVEANTRDAGYALGAAADSLVPSIGKADTVAGEIVRAMNRILYRDFNDGDVFYEGYGLETCGSSAQYIFTMIPELEDNFRVIADQQLEEERYTSAIIEIASLIIAYLKENPDLFGLKNTEDSRNYDTDIVADWEPKYEYEVDISGDLHDSLEEAGILDDNMIGEFIEDILMSEYVFHDAELNRWASDAFEITNLTREGYDTLEDYFPGWYESWLKEIMEENQEEYDAYWNGDEEEYEEDEYDESLKSKNSVTEDVDWDDDDEDDTDSRYEYIRSKAVLDSDGFYTDYTMYFDPSEDRYVFVFGDKDIYKPEDGYFDYEADSEGEADEWFNSYAGFEDDFDESLKN